MNENQTKYHILGKCCRCGDEQYYEVSLYPYERMKGKQPVKCVCPNCEKE